MRPIVSDLSTSQASLKSTLDKCNKSWPAYAPALKLSNTLMMPCFVTRNLSLYNICSVSGERSSKHDLWPMMQRTR